LRRSPKASARSTPSKSSRIISCPHRRNQLHGKGALLGVHGIPVVVGEHGLENPTDRDNFKYKRLELVGSLMYDLFREYYNLQLKHIQVKFEERLLDSKILYEKDLPLLIQTFHDEVFKTRVVEAGFKKAFKGNWGATANTKRVGIVQDLNRLSFNTYLSHLRKTNLPMDAGSKLVERASSTARSGVTLTPSTPPTVATLVSTNPWPS
jgi:DNA-directed RNA polymerase II subunit RPB2